MTTTTDPGRLRALFEAALDQPDATRAAWIDAQGFGAAERADLLRLLAASTAPGPLDIPAIERAASIGDDEDPAAPEGLIGQRIGAFRLVRLLGQGGMATVFLGEREGSDFDQQAAVKLLRRGLYSELEQRLFRRERRMLAMLSHPNIARMIDGGVTEAGIPYLVMEYVDGVPITEYANTHALDRDARLRLFLRVCAATDAAHRQLIVHRDLKPSNILVAADGTVKLLDFGIAKLLDEDDNTQRSLLAALTPDYAAPEQFAGAPSSTATDVHALGLLLHELLAGTRPARNAHGYTFAPELRGDLRNIIAKACAPEPTLRYATAGALGDDIVRCLDGLPVEAHPPSPWYRSRKFVQRHRVGVAIAAVFGMGLFAALALAQWNAHRAQREAATATAVKDFLTEVFASASPYARPGEDVRARDLLDAGAARLRPGMAGDPAVQTELLGVLARSYAELGLYAKAEPLARRALVLSERGTGANSLQSREARLAMAEILQASIGKRPREVAALATQVLSRAAQPDMLDMRAHALLARNLEEQNRHVEARAEHRIAIDQATALGKAAAPWLGNLWLHEARFALHAQDLAGARRATDRATPYLSVARHADAARAIDQLRTQAFLRLHAPGSGEQILPLYDRLVTEHGRVFGTSHPEHLVVLADHASVLQILGYPRQAQAAAEKMTSLVRANPGIGPREMLEQLAMLPNTAAARGDLRLAETEQRKLLDLARREFSPQTRLRQFAELDLLTTRAERGDPVSIRVLAKDQAARSKAIRPMLLPDALRVIRALRNTGEAERALAWLRALQTDAVRDATPASQRTHWLLRRETGTTLAMLGRNREAAAEFAALASLPPPYTGRRGRNAEAELQLWRGWLAIDAGAAAKALAEIDAALSTQREVFGDDSYRVAAARLFRARALATLHRDAEARRELALARPVLQAQLLPGHWLRRQLAALDARMGAGGKGMS